MALKKTKKKTTVKKAKSTKKHKRKAHSDIMVLVDNMNQYMKEIGQAVKELVSGTPKKKRKRTKRSK